MQCSLCENEKLIEGFSLGKQPLANKYPKDSSEILQESLFDMKVDFCENCLSAQIHINVAREIFFQDYYYLSSVNQELCDHFKKLSKELKSKKFVLDIGSNDGILLSPLKKINVQCLGIDPSENVGNLANDKGLKTLITFFDENCFEDILRFGGKPDCIVASSVFTHLEDPNLFIRNLKKILDHNGEIIIEVEHLRNILNQIQFERFYFDRTYYYSFTSIFKLFEKNEMQVVDVREVTPHGGSLRVYVKNIDRKNKVNSRVDKMLTLEAQNLSLKIVREKFDVFKNEIRKLKKGLEKAKLEGKNAIGYGAPARLATITNFGDIDGSLLSYVIDDSPLKASRLSPGKHIPIKSFSETSEKDVDIIVLFAYEYYSSIRRKFKGNSMHFFRPIPYKPMSES
jgi:methylation protein EvaC